MSNAIACIITDEGIEVEEGLLLHEYRAGVAPVQPCAIAEPCQYHIGLVEHAIAIDAVAKALTLFRSVAQTEVEPAPCAQHVPVVVSRDGVGKVQCILQ